MEELSNYQSFKRELDIELNKAAEGFVKIGYLLKRARDTNVLAESGYKSVTEFAKAEYNLSADVVSRYIAINDRFAEGGYAEELAAQYRNYGLAKLQEMLTLPAPLIEELSPELTREEIQTIKREYKAEQEISDIEIAIEAAEPEENGINISLDSNLDKIFFEYFKEFPSEYIKSDIFHIAPGNIAEHINPSGQKVIISRIKGVGKLMLTLKDKEHGADIVNMRTSEKEHYTWDDVDNTLCKLYLVDWTIDDINERYRMVFGEELPAVEAKEEKPKKEKKVSVVKPKKDTPVKDEQSEQSELKEVPVAGMYQEEKEMSEPLPENKKADDVEEKIPLFKGKNAEKIKQLYTEYTRHIERCGMYIKYKKIDETKNSYEKAGAILEQIIKIIKEEKQDD